MSEPLSLAKQSLIALQSLQAKLDASERARTEPIAIVGMGCRFPGGIHGPDSFWKLLQDGTDAISEPPANRRPHRAAEVTTTLGGYLDDVEGFDADFFEVSPREANTLDPQQRLVLEVAWEALEDAGQPPDKLSGTQTGVYIGVTTHDYLAMQTQGALSEIDSYFGTGTSPSLLSGRVSYYLGLQGPSLTVDTACSSSLVTVHLACQALRAGECNLALAGGVNLLLSPELTVYFSKIAALAPDGRCKAFDASADGFVRSEWCGIVVLKRLSDALANGDEVIALVRGSAINHDGRSNGLTAPNVAAQASVIRRALSSAGVPPASVEYVEAHGSGTPLGDPIELRAISTALDVDRVAHRPLWVGSVKSNFGHVEAAAGIAGLMKAALALRHGKIPAHLHFKTPTPHISWDGIGAAIPVAAVDWPARSDLRYAGVSSFGISGTNAHAILSDAPPAPKQHDEDLSTDHLLTISARSDTALRQLAERYRALLAGDPSPRVYDLCAAAALRRTHHNHRLAIVGRTITDFRDRLDAFLAGDAPALPSIGRQPNGLRRKIVFVFPGHGAQWFGMGKGLLETQPEFRAAMEECDRAIKAQAGLSVMEELRANSRTPRLDRVDVIQPLLFALEVSLARLWRFWGVEPDAVVGHSMGEVAAAHVAGALSLDDAALVICTRSKLLQSQSGTGAMAAVELSVEAAERAIAGHVDRVAVAASNGPRTTVISGEKLAVAEVVAALEKESVYCRRVNSDVAFHTPQMDALVPAMLRELDGLDPQPASVPFYSTVHRTVLQGAECDSRYWAANLRNPVLFWDSVQRLAESGPDIFIEMGPHPVLLPALEEGLRSLGREATLLTSMRRGESEATCLLEAAGKLYTAGRALNWARFYPRPARRVSLPTYPWQRERFWIEDAYERPALRPGVPNAPLLGRRIKSALHSGVNFWELDIDAASFPYLKDHDLFGELVFPAAAYVEMAFEAANDLWGAGNYVVENLAFEKMLVVPDNAPGNAARTVQIAVAEGASGVPSFAVYSRESDEGDWTLHVTGSIPRPETADVETEIEITPPGEGRARTSEDHYQRMRDKGLTYGPAFRGVESLTCFDREASANIRVPREIAASMPLFRMHPAILDAALQVLTAALAVDGLYIPIAIDRIRLLAQPDGAMTVHTKLTRLDSETLAGDIVMKNGQGRTVLEAAGVHARRISSGVQDKTSENATPLMYRVEWKPLTIESGAHPQPGTWILVSGGQSLGRDLARLLQQAVHRAIIVSPEDFSRSGVHVQSHEALRGVVYLAPGDEASVDAIESSCLSILDVVRSLVTEEWPGATPLFLVTHGGEPVAGDDAVSPSQASLRGLGRTIALEQPALQCKLIDLGLQESSTDAAHLFAELQSADGEDQVAWRGETRFAARLTPVEARPALVPAGSRCFHLQTSGAGVLDNLHLQETARKEPGPGQVEIEVATAGINFLDILGAMGARPDSRKGDPLRLGYECAGRVVRIGAGVTSLAIGDTVTAISPESLASHAIVPAVLASHFPSHLSMEEAASIPVAYVTAWYALDHLAGMQKGESVLIHSAAGGVGLAAGEIARRAGAEIFATAGTEEKRQYLRSLGIRHVMDSRTLAFRDEILRITNGRGVDIVLNSLTGEAVAQGIATLAPCGRFLEIGKKDIYEDRRIGLFPFHKNLSYFAIDLAWMAEARPEIIGKTLREVLENFQNRSLNAIPVNAFPLSRVVEAFHLMAQGKHIGRIVVTADVVTADNDTLVSPAINFEAGTCLITGGLGALGLAVAKCMVDRGATNLVLLGRTNASPGASENIAALRQSGANVRVMLADVSDHAQLAHILDTIDETMPPLAGVVHAAGTIDDGTALKLDHAQFRRVMAPKIQGAWNLHQLTRTKALEFFVMFSSASSVLGSPGQANYAAANAFMDGLAHLRRSQNLPAQSVNWGPWSGAGMAALGGRFEKEGIASMTVAQGIAAFESVLLQNQPQTAVLTLNAREWSAAHPTHAGNQRPLVRDLLGRAISNEAPLARDDFRAELRAASTRSRRALIETKLRALAAQVLRLSLSRVDMAETSGTLGFDSLMALELRNRLQSLLDLKLSASMVWNYPTIPALAVYLAQLLDLALDSDSPQPDSTNASPLSTSDLDALNENELSSLLDGELAHLGFSAGAKPDGQ